MNLLELLYEASNVSASDLHIKGGYNPIFRKDGNLHSLEGYGVLSSEEAEKICTEVLPEKKIEKLKKKGSVDFSFSVDGIGRIRANIFYQKGSLSGAFRLLPDRIMTLREIGLPDEVILPLLKKSRGLILVVGATGSGKSTTLASMIQIINSDRPCHIVTIEDPIEYVYGPGKALISQRELGEDVFSFAEGLQQALRQDPDVILVGEMRDLDTIQTALIAAETGHLVFATLHTNTAPETITRIVDVFPPHHQTQVRYVLSLSLESVICQALLPKISGGRVLAYEIMIMTPAIRNLIRENKIHQIYSAMQTGWEKTSMVTMNMCLTNLVKRGLISTDVAFSASPDTEELERVLRSYQLL